MMKKTILLGLALGAVSTAQPMFSTSAGAEASPAKVETLPAIGPHWLFVPDRLLRHSFLFDAQQGRMLGSIPSDGSLTPKLPLVSRSRSEILSVDLDYSRGLRGDRIDYITIYDARTLDVSGEVVLPHPTSESNTSLHHATLLDGDRFAVVFSQFPATVATVVDLESRQVVSEIPIAGCAGVYSGGPDRFITLCGDGTATMARLDESGGLVEVTRSDAFFDVVEDAVAMAGVRQEQTWSFVSFAGRVHTVDVAGDKPRAEAGWWLTSESERADDWRPGGLQPFALHAASSRLFAVMHQGGDGTHKDAGAEIWTFDSRTGERLGTIDVPNLTAAFLGTMLGAREGGMLMGLMKLLVPNEGAHAIAISQKGAALLYARHAELGAIAVIDADSGEVVRLIQEVGITGPTLGTP